jgi:hypothetical protein
LGRVKCTLCLVLLSDWIVQSVKRFKNSQQIDYATDHGNSYADRERNSPSFFQGKVHAHSCPGLPLGQSQRTRRFVWSWFLIGWYSPRNILKIRNKYITQRITAILIPIEKLSFFQGKVCAHSCPGLPLGRSQRTRFLRIPKHRMTAHVY